MTSGASDLWFVKVRCVGDEDMWLWIYLRGGQEMPWEEQGRFWAWGMALDLVE